ncbi:MAG: HEAT repeat domain-containing protein [Gemmatales bacterium]|nr:HEAT repeat domain-containing protein [Gemmatales bacterium]MDW8386229.1 HEAT repeat domain-containing protein [Gemmatales bacterium]
MLRQRLRSPFSVEVVTAARGLERLGPAAKSAVPDLNLALLRASFSDERIAIAKALGAIGPDAEEAALNLALALRKAGFPQERQAIMRALGKIGPGARPAVPILVEMLRSGLPEESRLAAEVLGEIGPAAQEAVPALRMAAGSGFSHIKTAAAEALQKIQQADQRFGVKDHGRVFSPAAVMLANDELRRLATTGKAGVVLETYANFPADQVSKVTSRMLPEGLNLIDAWALDRVRTADYNGLLILICRSPLQVAVMPTPTMRSQFDPQSCARLREQIHNRLQAHQEDQALRDVVSFLRERSGPGTRSESPAKPTPQP